jgi:hypothetical protein
VRGLQGDFNTMPLKDLIGYLAQKRLSGELTLERVGMRKQVFLDKGLLLNASSNDPREYLGQFLINLGHITEEQFNKAYETQKETKIFLGKILIMTGIVKDTVLQKVLSLKFRETVLEAFQWKRGSFDFAADRPVEPLDGIEFRLELMEIYREAEFRQTAWQAIRDAFPSGSLKLTAEEKNLPEPPRPGSLDAKIFELIREGHTIDEIGLAIHATDFFLYQRLYAMYRLEALRVDEMQLTEAPTSDLTPIPNEDEARSLMTQAQSSMEASDWAEADELARRAHQLSPSPETSDLLKQAEAKLLEQLRASVGPGKPIPRLLLAATQVKAMPLSAPERYLLSRVDGKRDLRAIVAASPIRELDALKFMRQFIDAGLVELG